MQISQIMAALPLVQGSKFKVLPTDFHGFFLMHNKVGLKQLRALPPLGELEGALFYRQLVTPSVVAMAVMTLTMI